MSEQDEKQTGNRPDFIAYNVRESRDGKGYWDKIGTAWRHRDGQGYDIALDSLPVNGRVTLRELREERMQGYQEQRKDAASNPETDRTRRRGRER
jgi:hypothetical protein